MVPDNDREIDSIAIRQDLLLILGGNNDEIGSGYPYPFD
jgi:hypothetical protein